MDTQPQRAVSPQWEDSIRADIRRLEHARHTAMVARDLHRLEALLSDDLVYTHSSGVCDTKRSYLEKVRDRTFVYDAIEHPEDKILVRDGAAVVIGRLYARARLSGESRRLRNAVTAVWAREGQRWKLVAYAAAPLPDGRVTGAGYS